MPLATLFLLLVSFFFLFGQLGPLFPFSPTIFFLQILFLSRHVFLLVRKSQQYCFTYQVIYHIIQLYVAINIIVVAFVGATIPGFINTRMRRNLFQNFFFFPPKLSVDALLQNLFLISIQMCVAMILRMGDPLFAQPD